MSTGDLLVVLGMALAVYVPKAVPLVAVSESLTSRLRPWLRYVAPAVLGALVAPAIVAPSGQILLALPGWGHLPYLAAFAMALLTRSMLPSIAAGLVVLIAVAIFRA